MSLKYLVVFNNQAQVFIIGTIKFMTKLLYFHDLVVSLLERQGKLWFKFKFDLMNFFNLYFRFDFSNSFVFFLLWIFATLYWLLSSSLHLFFLHFPHTFLVSSISSFLHFPPLAKSYIIYLISSPSLFSSTTSYQWKIELKLKYPKAH